MEPMIDVMDLRKTFPSKGLVCRSAPIEAVRGISLEIKRGEIFGLLGPNGAGKTTTMRMLCTLLTPTSGSVRLAGYDLLTEQAEVRTAIGYVSQVGGMERETSGQENLLLQARLHGLSRSAAKNRVEEVIRFFRMEPFADRKTVTYSGGQRRIFDLAAGIIHRPKLLFLDEPAIGLDPQNRFNVWEQVRKLRDNGTTIFLTTHYLEEADALCNRIGIVDHGSLVALGQPSELKRLISNDAVVLRFSNAESAARGCAALAGKAFIKDMTLKNEILRLDIERGDEHLPMLMTVIYQQGLQIQNIQLSRPTLDDVFIKLTGRRMENLEAACATL